VTLEQLALEIAALKARVALLEATSGGGGLPSSSTSSGTDSGDVRRERPIDDAQLENEWANKKIAKDPRRWKGPTQVNRTYSRAPVEWLEMAAASYEFKAHMGRIADPVRMSNKVRNGQPVPWHESDSFEARILRGWAERKKRAPPPPAAKAPPKQPTPPAEPGGDEDFNFGANAPTDADPEIGF